MDPDVGGLVTGGVERRLADLVLPVERGRADGLSMRTATLALFEAQSIGVAAKRPAKTVPNLKLLNELRERVVGTPACLPMPGIGGSRAGATRRKRKSRS
jgi:hypothetical protein